MKNCIRPHYEKHKPLKSGLIENSNFENNRDPCWYACRQQKNNKVEIIYIPPSLYWQHKLHDTMTVADLYPTLETGIE